MRSSNSSGACFSPTQKSKLGSNIVTIENKAKQTKKSKEGDAPSKAHNA